MQFPLEFPRFEDKVGPVITSTAIVDEAQILQGREKAEKLEYISSRPPAAISRHKDLPSLATSYSFSSCLFTPAVASLLRRSVLSSAAHRRCDLLSRLAMKKWLKETRLV